VSVGLPDRHARGFTLTELAVVFAIIGFLLATALYTLSSQTEQRNFEETRRRLDAARELLLGFAIVNGRLPCPATNTSPDEAGGGATACTTPYPVSGPPASGFLPARSIGYQVVDTAGYAIDAWGNRIRYAVSSAAPVNSDSPQVCRPIKNPSPPPTYLPPATPHFTSRENMRQNGIDCRPSDLVVCRTASGITSTTCAGALPVTNQDTVVAIVFSTGKNGAQGSAGIDEAANLNGDGVFVWHTPTPASAANGEFDDQMQWISVGELYGKLIAAGVLPGVLP
jgi:prepilin-type N-terminal cleavage/methylation domain-containing protein